MVHEAGPRIQKRKQHAVENAALPLKCSVLNLNIEEYTFLIQFLVNWCKIRSWQI